jgi:hypothetical protein
MTEEGPRPAACVGRESLLDLTLEITEFIHRERMVTAGLTADPEVVLQTGRPILVLLSHQTSKGLAITGAAALIAADAFVHPGSLATRLSRMLEQFGDVFTSSLS